MGSSFLIMGRWGKQHWRCIFDSLLKQVYLKSWLRNHLEVAPGSSGARTIEYRAAEGFRVPKKAKNSNLSFSASNLIKKRCELNCSKAVLGPFGNYQCFLNSNQWFWETLKGKKGQRSGESTKRLMMGSSFLIMGRWGKQHWRCIFNSLLKQVYLKSWLGNHLEVVLRSSGARNHRIQGCRRLQGAK